MYGIRDMYGNHYNVRIAIFCNGFGIMYHYVEYNNVQ